MIFVKIGENVVTAYGLYYKIQQFVLFAAFGLRDAITPIISFSHGMKDRKRINDGVRYGILYTMVIMAVGFIGIEILAEPFAGINIACQGIFQALDSGLESLVISVCRQFLFVIPLALLFAQAVISGMTGTWLVWLTFPIAEILSVIAAVVFMRKIKRDKIKNI